MRYLNCTLILTLLLAGPGTARAHEGHADAPGEQAAVASGAVRVSEQAQKNLGLRLASAELRPIEKTLDVIGQIEAVPGLSGTVSSRIAGRVVRVLVSEGEPVRRGQPVVEIESLQVGDPPPRVRYASPIDGTVIDRHIVAGESIEPNGHLLEVADLTTVLAVGRVFEGQVERIAVGQAVRVMVPSYPERSFEGVVERLGGQLDPVTRSLPLYARVRNPELVLRPNMRAVLAVVTERADTALVVPRSAVLGDFGVLFAFVADDADATRFERRGVVTGLADDRSVEILDGVLPGERVVTEGNYSLQFLPPEPDADAHAAETAAEHEPAAAHAEEQADAPSPAPRWMVIVALVAALGACGLLLRRRLARGSA